MSNENNKDQVGEIWITVERPGYIGKKREELESVWNQKYGSGNWRQVWETPSGEIKTFEEMFEEYIKAYTEYFKVHPEEAKYLTDNFSFAYDKDEITKDEAFDVYALYHKPGKANQFHHVALNIALEKTLGIPFKGKSPIKVRAGKPGTPESEWPAGWKWHPGRIPCTDPALIKDVDFPERWWQKGSIEDLYQSNKVIQVRK